MVRAGDRPPDSASRLTIDPGAPSRRTIAHAASMLMKGGVVVFPTDTLYALGADALNPAAVRKVFAAKGRSWARPIPLLVSDVAMAVDLVGELGHVAARLAERYWPGPLTLLVPAARGPLDLLTAGSGRVGLRVPDSPVALALLRRLRGPLTGTSANRAGARVPRDVDEVIRQLGDRVDLILDGGPVPAGSPSTVVDVTVSPPVIVREGVIHRAEIFSLLP